MERRRGQIPSKPTAGTMRKVLAVSGNLCAFPGCSSPIVDDTEAMVGEICHIRARSPGGPRYDATQTEQARHAFENLVSLCRNHHAVVDGNPGLYPAESLQAMKAAREDGVRRRAGREDVNGPPGRVGSVVTVGRAAGGVIVDSPNSIIARSVSLRGPSGGAKIQPAQGTIGAEGNACRYVAHLISRHNEYASRETSRTTAFRHGAISKNVEHRSRSQWRLLPMTVSMMYADTFRAASRERASPS